MMMFRRKNDPRDRKCLKVLLAGYLLFSALGCGGKVIVSPGFPARNSGKSLARTGYSIQIGAFSNLDNAIRLTEKLEKKGLRAYYFVHKSGLYKVRFGDFPTREAARQRAKEICRSGGVINSYFIVSPESYTLARRRNSGRRYVRDDIIETAESFIGLPYRWGGSSPDKGFDCSGLTMAVYHLNGLKLPRSSWQQFGAGVPIKRTQLKKGDLVFFSSRKDKRVSHVGIYTGRDIFIHAPGKGKYIRTDSLRSKYFASRYVGARTYIR